MSITVRAIRDGYYVHFRKIGDVFEIEDSVNEAGEVQAFSPLWMQRIDTDASNAAAQSPQDSAA